MAGRQNRMHTTTITINGVQVTLSANTPEELGQQIVALQSPVAVHRLSTARARLVSDLRPPTRTQDYQAPRVPYEQQICKHGMNCIHKDSGRCTRQHIPEEARSHTSSTSSTTAGTPAPASVAAAAKPRHACKFGKRCKNKDTTCNFIHDKPCNTFKDTGSCPYGDNCKFVH